MKNEKATKKIEKIVEKVTGKKVKSFILFADQVENSLVIANGNGQAICKAIVDQCKEEPTKSIVISSAKQVVLNDLLQNDDEDKQN